MPQLERIYSQIRELEPLDREELLFLLTKELLPLQRVMLRQLYGFPALEYPSIVKTPGVCGGAARLIRTRIPIWVLVRMQQLGISEADILRSYPTLRSIDLVQAWSYTNSLKSGYR